MQRLKRERNREKEAWRSIEPDYGAAAQAILEILSFSENSRVVLNVCGQMVIFSNDKSNINLDNIVEVKIRPKELFLQSFSSRKE